MAFEMVVKTADGCPIAWTRFVTSDMAEAEDTFALWRRHPNFAGGPFMLVLYFDEHRIDTHHYAQAATPKPAPRPQPVATSGAWLH